VVTLVNDGGGFARSIVVEASSCVVVNPAISFPAAAEPLACAVATVELVGPRLGDDVVIVGSGFMGCLLQLLSALKGCRSITVADMRPDALSRAKALGATRVVDVSTEDLGKVVRELTDGHGADVVYEVTGSDGGLSLSGDVAKMGGKLCIVAYHQGGSRSVPLGKWNWMALQIFNAHFRDRAIMLAALREGTRLVNAGLIDVSGFLTDIYPLEDIAEAFEKASAKPVGFLKAAIAP
jgi:L-iditol 2-dehydrogenase